MAALVFLAAAARTGVVAANFPGDRIWKLNHWLSSKVECLLGRHPERKDSLACGASYREITKRDYIHPDQDVSASYIALAN